MATEKANEGTFGKHFGLWSAVGLGWITLNVFGGMSLILAFALSAGGLPAILYGFIGSSFAVFCIILTFAQCASRYSTAGGAYHYACFLLPDQYRRSVSYVLGWLNYLGWIFTHAACCSIVATCTMALVNLCDPSFDTSIRWRLFLVYEAMVLLCWGVNVWGLRGIPTLELLGSTIFGFIAYTILLLVKAPKAEPSFVFVDTTNDTGYSSMSTAIFLGLFTSFATLMALDGPAHLAEEIPQPKKLLPRIMLIVIGSQFVVGVIWIIVLGFSITDLDAILATPTGIPTLELIRQATGGNAASIAFCVILMMNNGTSALGSAVTMTRQGFAFARDGGLFWNSKLVEVTPRVHTPFWSITLPSIFVALVGVIYLFSSAAFNAIIGSQVVCMIISFGFPALILLLTSGRTLPAKKEWNFGVWSKPIYIVSVLYCALVFIVAFIPQSHPITSLNMNYTILVMGVFMIFMTVSWFLEGHKLFKLPVCEDDAVYESDLIDGVVVDAEAGQEVTSVEVIGDKRLLAV
ncbi:hypothetical protein SAPIO_CDS0006 [Scedosporium apiospermum]|uniref:Choline transport protein n=1 Tax=Pseudallescheria apiosperma TaxID=563466 RepID=A0A084GHB8_PSEDA|nr:uncharacterized protein SAPIO_CDS0006 [Scedosporium apiospermum]KEZ46730.1 hypothetical protein SAPIO_CDS0006 [Scedosporium apiospermum]